MPIIGLTGPNASGKGEVAAYLESQGFRVFSLSDIIREALSARSLEPTRERMIEEGTALRREHGPGVLAARLAERLVDRNVVDSIRNPSEVAELRRVPGFVLWLIDAPPALRFARSCKRGRVGDAETLERFIELEARENTTDPSAQQLTATGALADDRIENDDDLDALHAKIDRRLATLDALEGEDFGRVVDRLRAARKVVAITGAGISAESGVEMFRTDDESGDDGGLWARNDLDEVATAEALERDPATVWRFLLEVRETYREAKPNPGHEALAAMADRFESLGVITQNIDGLHRAGGSRDVIELHGNASTARGMTSGDVVDLASLDLTTLPPEKNGEVFRPNVVYFGELYDPAVMETVQARVLGADVILVIGTSGVVPTPYWLADQGKSAGAFVVEINPTPSAEGQAIADAVLTGPAGAILPALAEALAPADA